MLVEIQKVSGNLTRINEALRAFTSVLKLGRKNDSAAVIYTTKNVFLASALFNLQLVDQKRMRIY